MKYEKNKDVEQGKFKGNYDAVRLTAFCMVMIQHFFVTCSRNNIVIPLRIARMLESSINPGTVGVGLFFLLSGSVLWRNNKDNSCITFYRKHLLGIILPIWVTYFFFAVIYYAKNGLLWDVSILQIVLPLLGGNFFAAEMQRHLGLVPLNFVGEWFTSVILILYLLYPFLRTLFKRNGFRYLMTVCILLVFWGNFHVDFLIYQDGHISLTLGLFYFWMGMYFEEYREYIMRPYISVVAAFAGVIIWMINPEALFGVRYLPNIPVILLLYAGSYSISGTFYCIRWICVYSYIVYLIHHTLMNWLVPVMGASDMGFARVLMMFGIFMVMFFSIGISEKKICDYILNLLRKKR